MSSRHRTDLGGMYEIRVFGKLSSKWSDWFDGFCIEQTNGETVLTGHVADQAALHGVLAKIRDLGLSLLLVKRTIGNRGHLPEE
jgi:hypothetical protein